MAFLLQGAVVCLFKRFALPFFGDSLFGWKLGLDLCYLSKKYRMCEAHCPGHIVLILGGGVGKPGGGGRQVLLATYSFSADVTNVWKGVSRNY